MPQKVETTDVPCSRCGAGVPHKFGSSLRRMTRPCMRSHSIDEPLLPGSNASHDERAALARLVRAHLKSFQ